MLPIVLLRPLRPRAGDISGMLERFTHTLDQCLSPDMRQAESSDVFRARFLVFAICFSIPCNIAPCLLQLMRSGSSAWIREAIIHTIFACLLLFKLKNARSFQKSAQIFILWIHGLVIAAMWLMPSAYSMVFVWIPCIVVLSSLMIGVRWAFVSAFSMGTSAIANIVWRGLQLDNPESGLEFAQFSKQMPFHLLSSCLFMAIMTGVYEYLRESLAHSQARQQMLAARHAHTGTVGELVGQVAHEVNNPLAILQGSAARLRRQLERNELTIEAQKLLKNMQRSLERIQRVQEGLSVFALGNRHEPYTRCQIKSIFREVQIAMNPQALAHQVRLNFVDRTVQVALRCQAHQIAYVLCSLVQNALDACRNLPETTIDVEAQLDGKFVKISISDNGPGIEPSIQARMFQPFVSTKTGGATPGLSLSVGRGILLEHGGEIWFTSRPGSTTFVCQLPQDSVATSHVNKGA